MKTKDTPTISTLASSLALKIQTDIIDGTLRPGERLRTSALSKRYNASLVPIREALSRLASTGFVLAEDQRGFRVAEVSEDELLDITNTRIIIESEALRRSIAKGDLTWESNLLAAHHRLKRIKMTCSAHPGLDPDWEGAHARFHDALLAGCDSKCLLSISATLRDQTARYRHLSVQATDGHSQDSAGHALNQRDVMAEHEALLQAALDRNAELSVDLLGRHFRKTTELVMKHIEQQAASAL